MRIGGARGMGRRVRWLTLYTSVPMGQQTYEASIQQGILDLAESGWEFRSASVGSGRSAATYHVPQRILDHRLGASAVGALTSLRSDLVHRFDLRVPRPRGPHVLTLHDLPPMRFDDEGSLPQWCSDPIPDVQVICPSEFAAAEVTELLGAPHVTVIPYGVRPSFQRPEPLDASALDALGISRPFFVHAAGVTRRKNLEGLADAWAQVAPELPDHELVLLGPPSGRREELFGDLPRVVLAGKVDLDVVGRVMAAAEAVVVPSIYEGNALMTQPEGASIAEALEAVGRGEIDREDLVRRGLDRAATFSWEKAARAHLDVYRRVCG